ncbi:hypothetical protein S7711_11540 [Stachybotrys chartarum IBT 7711]|uniref:Uncharacterized protein n=1 Tax=Stachybotrys chartarum (strain CBS 109288 / IBT 7711) TaxID=1280523 RepID=A0A084B8G6_STACB|nr:hypothetical protein S7711_11540 [Stachybotrys chartarum IBT 7711]KFA80939.1 hypothetical protein S40288_11551 [Stachybotrys chartarum IBT 40288]
MGLVNLHLKWGNNRRDLLGSVQSMVLQVTEVGDHVSTLLPDMTAAAGVAASRVTAAVSNAITEAASLESFKLDELFTSNYTVGTKYACAASECNQVPSLEVVLCFGLVMAIVSAVAFALAFFLPFMRLVSLGCSMLAMIFFIVLAASVVFITQTAVLLADSTSLQVEKGDVFAGSLWSLASAIVMAFSTTAVVFLSLPRARKPKITEDVHTSEKASESRMVPTWARRPARQISQPAKPIDSLK